VAGGVHRNNLLFELADALRITSERNSLSPGFAFNRVAAEWLGYDLDEANFVDGAGDRGIDFWFESDSGFDIFQCKSHDLLPNLELDSGRFDSEGVSDLDRAKLFLLTDSEIDTQNEKLMNFRHSWEHAVSSRRAMKDPEPLAVNLALILLGEGLTPQAQKEFDDFQASLQKSHSIGTVPIELHASLYTVEDLLQARWRLDNREWRDSKGTKKDWVDLFPEEKDEALEKKDTAVFYCRAVDLVRAYQEFGYQIFEPNVRCNINHSKVNAAIRESVKHRTTREEFRFLNNGVTIVCQNFQKPSANRPCFRVTKPGVVNGLQTVFSLHEAYGALPQEDKVHFEGNCYVLVRLLQEHSVRDLNRLVRATNTQNPMQARNLVSNNTEQAQFERLFAELGWFYERKQGAWEAFAADPRRWRTLPNKSKAQFQVQGGGGRPRVRRIDNEVLGQTWLSFVGFSEEAVQKKREIFENAKWYDFIFQHVPKKHGFDFQYRLEDAMQDSLNQAPPPGLMLASFLAREFARRAAPTVKENREAAIKRLRIDVQRMRPEQVQDLLAQDNEFILGQVLNGTSFEFVEFIGFILFRSLEGDLTVVGPNLLRNGMFLALSEQLDFDLVKGNILSQKVDENDVLAVSWWTFRHVLEELIGGAWLSGYRAARNRIRFLHSNETRRRLEQGAIQLHDYMNKTQLTRTWAVGIRPGKGLFGFVREALLRGT
jgi:AIPR protein